MNQAPASSTRSEIGDVEVVGFDEGLLEQAAYLRAAIFGGTPEANDAYLRWKFLENPYFPEPVVFFATRAGRVVGFRGAMGTCWEVDGHRHVLPHGADLMVDARFRRGGIARRLLRAHVEMLPELGAAVALSFSAGGIGVAATRASGWEVIATLDMSQFSRRRPTKLRLAVARGRRAAVRIAGKALGSETSLTDPFSKLDREVPDAVSTVEPTVADELAAIAARAAPAERLRHVRDAEYFRWRLRNPLSHYRVLRAPKAYLVLQWSGRGAQVNIVDWRAATAHGLAELVGHASRHVPGLRLWEASLSEDMSRALSEVGAARISPAPPASFVVRSATGDRRDASLEGLDPFEPSSWEFRMLDSDEY